MKIKTKAGSITIILIAVSFFIIILGFYIWVISDLVGNPDDEVNDDVSDLSLGLEDVVLTRSYWTDAGLVEPPWYISGGKWTSSGHDDTMWAYDLDKDVIVPLEWENDTMWAWGADKDVIVRHTYFLCLKINLTNTGDEDLDLSGRSLLYGFEGFAY